MKLLHTADWHIGRTLNGYSLLNEQKAAFQQILNIALEEHVDGIVIAGDIYDRAIPNVDAVTTLNEMFKEINIEHHLPIYAISGNHDGAKRLNYGRDWMEYNNFHLNTLVSEAFNPIETTELKSSCCHSLIRWMFELSTISKAFLKRTRKKFIQSLMP